MKTSTKADTPLPPTSSSDSSSNATASSADSSIGQAGLAANNAITANALALIQAAEANPLAAISQGNSTSLDIVGNSTLNQPVGNGSEIQTTPVIATPANGIMETASQIGQAGLAANNATLASQEAQIQAKSANPSEITSTSAKPEVANVVPLATVTDTTTPVAKPETIATPGNTKTEINGSSITVKDNASGQSVTVEHTALNGTVVKDASKGVGVSTKPSGNSLITVPVAGSQPIEATYNKTTKEISYNNNGIQIITSPQTLQQFETTHKNLAPNTEVSLTNGDQIIVNANGVERITTPTQVIFKLPNGGNTYTFENSPNGLLVQTNNGSFVSVNDASLTGIINQNSDGSYHLTGSGNNIGANLGHVTDITMVGANGQPLKTVIGANGKITTNADNPPVNIHWDQTTGTFQILSTNGSDLVNINTTNGSIYNSDFNLSASGNVTLWNGETILANGSIQDSYGNTIYDNNNDTTDSSSFNNNPNFNNTATLDSSVGGIVNNIEGKVTSGDVSLSDISHLELCLGALDNAMNRAQAIGNVALISELSSCQATIGNVLGQAQAALKTDINTHQTANTNITKPKNDFNHYDIMTQHSNYNFSSTAKLLYA